MGRLISNTQIVIQEEQTVRRKIRRILRHSKIRLARASLRIRIPVRMRACLTIRSEVTTQYMSGKFSLIDM